MQAFLHFNCLNQKEFLKQNQLILIICNLEKKKCAHKLLNTIKCDIPINFKDWNCNKQLSYNYIEYSLYIYNNYIKILLIYVSFLFALYSYLSNQLLSYFMFFIKLIVQFRNQFTTKFYYFYNISKYIYTLAQQNSKKL
ncbi:unnamed protein product (macronuclear) [Paramecium tetraurelia]|uniref:Chromosome undetermined scaffold_226, whole genome shotgun sequence n=1 Tax=Paramecium tetraurelia TaxID=5888 RepID=A0CNZ4_PARTE|nr:uncharacterized protein GSPATT00038780001 [Paramecium tetraurelia]XP_001458510.1 uncharacterized protein GSPATT00023841001 [Paramecium tetraurelia]CAK72511.1 unnamed protein product [Paramecium tetraurelia]CAK91113.1 unnamed protein product [Paramecium tetraurelia]|eukprot:XP_001439908.1 hypothetical protein (macronuclear) [Paramecium tetraurelia strain d4-2]